MYQLSDSLVDDLHESKTSICTWQELSDYITRKAEKVARKVDLSLINKFKKIGDVEAPIDLYNQLKQCIYLDFLMCFLTYNTIEREKKKRIDIFRKMCHDDKESEAYNNNFFENHKGYLYNTYNKLTRCVDFFNVYHEKLFSSKIDEDFVRFCLIHAGKLPKKLPLYKPCDIEQNKELVEYNYIKSSKKPCAIFETIWNEINDISSAKKENYHINRANCVLHSSFAAVAYHLEQHYMICSCVTYFSDIRHVDSGPYINFRDIYDAEDYSINEEPKEVDAFFNTLTLLPTPLIRLSLIRINTCFRRSAEHNPKYAFKNLVQKDKAIKMFYNGSCEESKIIDKAIIEYQDKLRHYINGIIGDELLEIVKKAIDTKCKDLTQEQIDFLCTKANEEILMFYQDAYNIYLENPPNKLPGKKKKDKALLGINYVLNKYYSEYLENIMQVNRLWAIWHEDEISGLN